MNIYTHISFCMVNVYTYIHREGLLFFILILNLGFSYFTDTVWKVFIVDCSCLNYICLSTYTQIVKL